MKIIHIIPSLEIGGTEKILDLITEKLKGTNLDEGAIMNAETQRLIHKMSLDIIDVMFDNLPNILDSISADMRLKADKNYKCSLQSNDYKNKECK